MRILVNTSIIFLVCLEALQVKYSVAAHEGSGQPQEAQLIGSTQMSRRACDQSTAPRAPPQFPSSVDTCVSNCSSPKRCAVSNYRLTTSLSDVLTLLLISFTVMCTQEHTAGRDDSSNLVLQPHFL